MMKRWIVSSIAVLCVAVLSGGVVGAQDGMVELVYGQTIDGLLDNTQPSVFFMFNATGGDVVTITMIATSGDLDPFLVLNDAAQSPLTTDDNSGGDNNAELVFVIPTDGRYIVQATNAGGIPPENGGGYRKNHRIWADGISCAADWNH